jgi:trafficking protein particle complex subunit 10
VTIPPTHILHTAALSIISPDQPSTRSSPVGVIGKPLTANLCIKHTRRWASPGSLVTAARLSSADDPIEFVYSVEANPEIWLVAGQRRGHFTAKEGEVHKVAIMLLPLKSGNFLLPSVHIHPRIKSSHGTEHDGKEGVEETERLNCEVDYLSAGECIVVVPDIRGSTVGIADLGSPKSVVWMDSQPR